MSLHKKLMHICNVRDLSSYLDMLHDDWKKIVQEYYNQLEEQGPTDYDAY